MFVCKIVHGNEEQQIHVAYSFESVIFVFNVYLNKCVCVCILLYDIKPNRNNLLLAVHVRPFPDCVQGNYLNHWHRNTISTEHIQAPTCC